MNCKQLVVLLSVARFLICVNHLSFGREVYPQLALVDSGVSVHRSSGNRQVPIRIIPGRKITWLTTVVVVVIFNWGGSLT